eukprot:TRINITY_DN150_c0_g1_i2.p1 TRINITY_DN150_c0_g1~~TRINITY_DN150_c0_g1_i2.p1  ORF type:complete len:542 (-),score=84.78 TRINITY_DN150_c0_g1_i2:2842-4329(-)
MAEVDTYLRKHTGRPSFSHSGQIRATAQSSAVSTAMRAIWGAGDRPVRKSQQRTGTAVLQSKRRSAGNGGRRSQSGVQRQKVVRFSTVGIDQAVVPKNHSVKQLFNHYGCSVLAKRGLVANVLEVKSGVHRVDSRSKHVGATVSEPRTFASDQAMLRIPAQMMKMSSSVRERLLQLAVEKYAPKTRTAYAAKLDAFVAFCLQRGRAWLPATPQTCGEYLLHLQDENRVHGDSVTAYFTVINQLHKLAGLEAPADHPLIRAAIAGFRHSTVKNVRRLNRTYLPVQQVHAVTVAGMRALSEGRYDTAVACAVVVFSFIYFWRASTAAAQRLSAVRATDGDIQVTLTFEKRWTHHGVKRTLSFTKVNHPEGDFGAHPFEFLHQFVRWRKSRGGKLLFSSTAARLSQADISAMWQTALTAARVKAPAGKRYLPHSGRKGGPTAASCAGVDNLVLAARGGWKNVDSILSYVVPATRHPVDFMYVGFLSPVVAPMCSTTVR